MLSVCELSRTVSDRLLWQGLNLEVGPGERVAVTGPSGSGKSLFLRALAGLDPLQGGDVRLDGRPQGKWPMPAYRSRVMYLPQRPALGTGLVADALRRPFRLKAHAGRPYPVQEAARLLEALERPASFEAFEVATLSGGEGQLLALVRALLLGPRLLLLDEATSALDPETTRLAEALLEAWCRAESDRALLWVSHDPAQRERVAGRQFPLVGA